MDEAQKVIEPQKKVKKAKTMSHIGYSLLAAGIAIALQSHFKGDTALEFSGINVLALLMEISINVLFVAGIVVVILSIVQFRKLRKEGIIPAAPALPKIVLSVVLTLLLLLSAMVAWLLLDVRSSSSTDKLPVADKAALAEIITKIIQDPDNYTKADHDAFWALARGAKLSQRERDQFLRIMNLGFDSSLLFWEDVLVALRLGRPYTSGKRIQLEQEIMSQGLESTKNIVAKNDKLMRELILTKKAIIGGEEIIVNEALVTQILKEMGEQEKKIKRVMIDLAKE